MNAGKAVYGILSANSGVTDLVGTRIFPEIAEQEAATPFIVYQLQSVAPEDTHDGPSKLDEVRFEFLCYADTYDAAADVGVKVRAALDRVSGTYNGVNVESVQFNDVDIELEYQPRRYSQVLKFTFRIKRDDFTIAQGTPVTGAQLGQLADVDVDGVSNGQLIAYNSTSGNWEAADDATGNNTLTGLTDTSITTPADRESLIYDSGNWVNDNLTKSDVGLANVDNTSDADKPISSATQTALNAKADTSAVPTELNDLSDVTITGTPSANEALIFDTATSSFKSLPNFTNRFEDEAENNKPATPFVERVYTVKADGDGIFIDAQSDTPSSGKVIQRKIYHKAGFLESGDAIGDFTLINTFADDTAYSATESVFEGFRDGDTYGSPPFTLIQTWEESSTFTGLLNESYGSGAAAAYSVRRLNGNYTGAAIEVERSSDNTKQDIGFDANGDLDESALETFCTGTTGKVRTWYDQAQTGGTGSGNDAVQTTHANQPTIYTGGAIVKQDGRPILQSNSLTTGLVTTETGVNNSTFFGVIDTDPSVSKVGVVYNGGTPTHDYLFLIEDGSTSTTFTTRSGSPTHYVNGVTASFTRNSLFDFAASRSLNSAVNFDGSSYTYEFGWSTNSGIGMPSMQEAIFYASDKSTDRTNIESNIGDYFTQNTPLLDTYTGAAAAYSLRKLRTAYSGSAVRVRRSNDNAEADIGFNVFGELDTVSLAAHCGSNDGFVKTLYDQSGNTDDATQTSTSNQPKIYDGTTGVMTENGKPTMDFDGSNHYFVLSIGSLNINNMSVHTVCRSDDTSGNRMQFTLGTDANVRYWHYQVSAKDRAYYGAASPFIEYGNMDTDQHLYSFIAGSTSTVFRMFRDGTEAGSTVTLQSGTPLTTQQRLGAYHNNALNWSGTIQEFVLYSADSTNNRTGIESNINTFYNIYS